MYLKSLIKNKKQNEQVPKLENLNLQIKKGELIGVIGSVGSGKVSLCSCVSICIIYV